jgi:hypothetical protein
LSRRQRWTRVVDGYHSRRVRFRLALTLLLVGLARRSIGTADEPPPTTYGFIEGWEWFMSVRDRHPILEKLDPELAAELWQRQGHELWPGRGAVRHATSVEDENGLIALSIAVDGPSAWDEMSHLLGPRGTAHLELVDPDAPAPAPRNPPAPQARADRSRRHARSMSFPSRSESTRDPTRPPSQRSTPSHWLDCCATRSSARTDSGTDPLDSARRAGRSWSRRPSMQSNASPTTRASSPSRPRIPRAGSWRAPSHPTAQRRGSGPIDDFADAS